MRALRIETEHYRIFEFLGGKGRWKVGGEVEVEREGEQARRWKWQRKRCKGKKGQ